QGEARPGRDLLGDKTSPDTRTGGTHAQQPGKAQVEAARRTESARTAGGAHAACGGRVGIGSGVRDVSHPPTRERTRPPRLTRKKFAMGSECGTSPAPFAVRRRPPRSSACLLGPDP